MTTLPVAVAALTVLTVLVLILFAVTPPERLKDRPR